MLQLKYINNLDIQIQEQITCFGYIFTIFCYTTPLRNVRQMWQMTAVSGEGLMYSFPVPIILFSSVLHYFADSFSDHVTFRTDVLLYDGLNKIWSLEMGPGSERTQSFAYRNWEKRGISQSKLPVSLPRIEPIFTAAKMFSHIRKGPKVFSSGLHLDLTISVWDIWMILKVTRRSKIEIGGGN
jgi:hypothetical protein